MKKKKEVEIYDPRPVKLFFADMEYIPQSDFSALNLDSFHRYRDLFRLYQPNHPYNGLQDEEFSLRLGFIIRLDKEIKCTKAGLLLFGNDYMIRRYYPYYELRLIDERDPYQINQPTRVLESGQGNWNGNLFEFILKGSALISESEHLFRWSAPNDGYLVQIVREAISIASCNVDFNNQQSIHLQINETALSLSFGVAEDLQVASIQHNLIANPTIANALACINLAKRKGMGYPFIKKLAEHFRFPKPTLEKNPATNVIELTLPLSKAQNDLANHTKQTPFDAYLSSITELEVFSRNDVIKATGKSPASASNYLKQALKEGKIKIAEGFTKGKYSKA